MPSPFGIQFHRPNIHWIRENFPKPHDNLPPLPLSEQLDQNGIPFPHTDAARQGRSRFLAGLVTRNTSHTKQSVAVKPVATNGSTEDFNNIISKATSSTLFPALRGISIPSELTDTQQVQIHALLKQHHPELLTTSPIVDVEGKPIDLELDLDSVTSLFGNHIQLHEEQKQQISNMFNNYSHHLESLTKHTEIRKVKKGDVPKHEVALEGQDGVFAKKPIEEDTFVCMFDGMLLERPEDIENDKKLRKIGNCDNYYSNTISQKGNILEGMGISMKLNVATRPCFTFMPDLKRTNLDTFFINATNKETGEKLKFNLFKTNRNISENEQLCFHYDINDSR